MELIRFIFSDFWHWLGTFALVTAVARILCEWSPIHITKVYKIEDKKDEVDKNEEYK